MVKPNAHEVEHLLNLEIQDAGLAEAGRRLMALLPGTAVLITRGQQGMALFRAGAESLHVPTVAHHVFDVTGAGDTVAGVLALALATGAPAEPATRLANLAAGIVVSKVGTATPTLGELRAASLEDGPVSCS